MIMFSELLFYLQNMFLNKLKYIKFPDFGDQEQSQLKKSVLQLELIIYLFVWYKYRDDIIWVWTW